MSAVLVVCTGNVCRSPMAEGFLRAALDRRFGQAAPHVSSAGTAGWEGSGARPESVEVAAERGVDIAEHAARLLEAPMLADADLVVCMAAEHREAVGSMDPGAASKAFTLKELTTLLESTDRGRTGRPEDLGARVAAAAALRADGAVAMPADQDIVDPLGSPRSVYRAIAWELDTWIERLVEATFGPADRAGAVTPEVR
jgi:protein-tyrosine phosphatase